MMQIWRMRYEDQNIISKPLSKEEVGKILPAYRVAARDNSKPRNFICDFLRWRYRKNVKNK
jgi:hypothetical protein